MRNIYVYSAALFPSSELLVSVALTSLFHLVRCIWLCIDELISSGAALPKPTQVVDSIASHGYHYTDEEDESSCLVRHTLSDHQGSSASG